MKQQTSADCASYFDCWLCLMVSQLLAVCRGKNKGPLPQDSVQALDVALKNTASNHPDCVTLPRAFFFYDAQAVKSVGGGAEVRLSMCAYFCL